MKRFLLLAVFFSAIFGSALSLLTLRVKQELPSCCDLSKADWGYPFTFLSSEKELYRVLKCDSFKCPAKDKKIPLVRAVFISDGMIDYYPLAHISTGLFWSGVFLMPLFLIYGLKKHGPSIHRNVRNTHERFTYKKQEHHIPEYAKRNDMPWQVRPPKHPLGHHPVSALDDELKKPS